MDEELCIKCSNKRQYVRRLCRSCYNLSVKEGIISVKKRSKSPDELSSLQKDILIGSMLGDGNLSKTTNTSNPYFRINRSLKDKDYLMWEYEIFKDFCDREPWLTRKHDRKRNKIYYGISFSTRASSVLKPYRNMWYSNGVKIIPPDLKLNSQIIAIWFCDDGCIINTNNYLTKSGKRNFIPSVNFATNCFSKEEVNFLSGLLSNKYDINFRVNKYKQYYEIYGAKCASTALINDIIPFIPFSMKRKIEAISSYGLIM